MWLLPRAEKHYAGAITLYTKALELQPDNAAVLYANRAFAHIKIEEYGSAVLDASKAVSADPTYAKVIMTLMLGPPTTPNVSNIIKLAALTVCGLCDSHCIVVVGI